jgi:hypothetical protein
VRDDGSHLNYRPRSIRIHISRRWKKKMSYIEPKDVISPKAHWHLFDVVLDRKEGRCAYALGTWDGERRIGFRWNGDSQSGPLGNPQSRGLPTWTMLDPALHEAVIAVLPPEKQMLAKSYLGVRTTAEQRAIIASIWKFHDDQTIKITSASPPVALLDGPLLIMHVVPFSAFEGQQTKAGSEIFRNPDKFSPIGANYARDSKLDYDGLLLGSNQEGLAKQQRAYVHVFRSGAIEAVTSSLARGREGEFLELPRVEATIIHYARFYVTSLYICGIIPPMVIMISLLRVKGKRLLQNFATDVIMEDMAFGDLKEDKLYFGAAIFETVPVDDNESAKVLDPILTHLANAAGLPSSPYIDVEGNYTLKLRV